MSAALLNTVLRAGRSLPLNGGERLVLLVAAWRADESGRTFMPGLAVLEQAGLSTQAGYPALRRLANFGLLRETRPVTIDVSRLHQMACADLLGEGETSKEVASKQLANTSKEVASKEVASKELASKKVANFLANNLPQDSKELATYKLETIKTRSTACAREGEHSVSGEGAPTGDGEAEVRAVSPATGRAEPVTVRGWEALRAFRGAYPKPPRDLQALNREWALLEREGVDGRAVALEELLGALAEAKLSKQWQEDGGRFVPRPEVWLGERQFVPLLQAARERRAAGKTQAEREAEETARAKEAAEATGWLADEEI